MFRYLRRLKRKITNKYRVEESIAKTYLLEEAAKFASYYFGGGQPEISTTMQRNEVRLEVNDEQPRLSVFQRFGRVSGKMTRRYLLHKEYVVA